jgi:hypothetical protein
MSRTAALGDHVPRYENDACGYTTIAYNSCRNRHCPKCQAVKVRDWMEAREAELLPVHVADFIDCAHGGQWRTTTGAVITGLQAIRFGREPNNFVSVCFRGDMRNTAKQSRPSGTTIR